ncbi:MAG: YciI family protein [Deltaproteobacteria bacterium]|nr:YciI family protein [Deltaproteobacteria bacterium]
MAKFMFLYRGGHEKMKEMSPEQMQQGVQAWMSWIQGGTDAGWLLDGGDGLNAEGQVVQSDLSVIDGPFAESKELVGGYSMVEAADLGAATELAKTSPMPAAGGTVEVRQLSGHTSD